MGDICILVIFCRIFKSVGLYLRNTASDGKSAMLHRINDVRRGAWRCLVCVAGYLSAPSLPSNKDCTTFIREACIESQSFLGKGGGGNVKALLLYLKFARQQS